MINNVEQFTQFNKANIETAVRFSNIVLSSVENLVNLQLNVTKQWVNDNAQVAQSWGQIKDVQGLVAASQTFAKPDVEKLLAVSRDFYEIAASAQNELSQLVEEQVAAFNQNVVSALDKALKSAPAGSDVAVAAIKSAMLAANSAYNTVAKTAKKVSADLAEAGAAAAASSVQVVNGAAKKAKAA